MNKYICKSLREGRINSGLKQSDVYKLIGIKNTTLSNYENGITEPDMDTFLKLCELYSLDYVQVISDAYSITPKSVDFLIGNLEKDMIKKYRDLDIHGKKLVDLVLDNEFERCHSGELTEKDIDEIRKEYTETGEMKKSV